MTKDTKTALLDFAEYAARAHGYDGFSYADLAEAIGIRKASIHYHFPSKSDLSVALMDRYTADMQQACDEISATANSAAQKLTGLIQHYRNALNGGETLCLCVSFTMNRDSMSEAVKQRIAAFRRMMIDWLTGVFELATQDKSVSSTRQPRQEAFATLALLEGAHIAARANKDVAEFDAAVDLLVDRLKQ